MPCTAVACMHMDLLNAHICYLEAVVNAMVYRFAGTVICVQSLLQDIAMDSKYGKQWPQLIPLLVLLATPCTCFIPRHL